MQSRFLHIQIYNETGTEVEYDNLIDTDWGIQVASASLNSQIMEKELRFGNLYSAMFQVTLFNLAVDLKGRRIKVGLNYNTGHNCIVDGAGNRILVDEDVYLVYREMADVSQVMFDGTIISSIKDRQGSDRTILAYDNLYSLRDVNIADFWNSYWENRETSTLAHIRNALLTYVDLDTIIGDFINDNLVIKNYFENPLTQFRFQDLMKMICELQNVCPHLNPNTRNIELISLRTVALHDIRQKVEGQNSAWEDFTTEQITGVGVYNTGGDLAQIVGTSHNVYNLVGNVFLNGASAETITEACNNMLAELSTIQFVPGSFKLIISEPDWNLGDQIYSDYGMSYMFGVRFSGSILIDETISCKQTDAFLNKDVESYNDTIMEGLKLANIEKTVDSFKIDYEDFKENVSTEFEQTAEKIVMKVDDNGNVGIAELGSDEVDETYMKFKANKIEITSDTIKFDNNGYEVRGDVYTTIIHPDDFNVISNYPDVDYENFTYADIDLLKTIQKRNTGYFLTHDDTDVGNGYLLQSYNSILLSSLSLQYSPDVVNPDGYMIGWGNNRYILVGRHLVMTEDTYTNFLNDGGFIDDDGYLDFTNCSFPASVYFDDVSCYCEITIGENRTYADQSIVSKSRLAKLHYEDLGTWEEVTLLNGEDVIVAIGPEKSMNGGDIYDWTTYHWGSYNIPGGHETASLLNTLTQIISKL